MAPRAALRFPGEASRASSRLSTMVGAAMGTGLLGQIRWPGLSWALTQGVREPDGPSKLIRFLAHNDPHRIALTFPGGDGTMAGSPGRDRLLSFFELDECLDRLSLALRRRGLGRGRAALLVLRNCPELILLTYAMTRIGAPVAAVSPRSRAPELAYYAKKIDAAAIFTDADAAAEVDLARAELGQVPAANFVAVGAPRAGFVEYAELLASAPTSHLADAPRITDVGALLSFTSGTTGRPKATRRRVTSDALAGALGFVGQTPMRAGQVHLAVCPLHHATAQGFVGFSYLLGCRVVLLREFCAESFLEAIARYRVNTTAVVPTMLHRVVELGPDVVRKYDTSSLRAIFCGGAPLTGPLAARVTDLFGERLYNVYGSAEHGPVTLAGPKDLAAYPGTIGRPAAGVSLQLVDEAGAHCAVGEVGELYARSPMMVDGYLDDPRATREAMRDGHLSVGDLARRNDDGCYFIEGRKRGQSEAGKVLERELSKRRAEDES